MKKIYLNKLEMYRTVREIMDANETSWEGIPNLVSKVNEFKEKIQALEKLSEVQEKITLGVTEARTEFKKELINKALRIADALYVFANDNQDLELKANVKITRSVLCNTARGKAIVKLDRIILEAVNYTEFLEEYGITQEMVIDLKNRRDVLVSMETRTRTVVINRVNYTRSIKETIESIDKLLKSGMDKLILQNGELFGEWVPVYSKARTVMQYGNRQKKENNGTTEN